MRWRVDKAVVCIVDSRAAAAAAVDELQIRGFSRQAISVFIPDHHGGRHFAHEQHTKAPEGAITGVIVGGLLGGLVGLLASLHTLPIPGAAALMAAGSLMAALSGAAAGATVAGIAGALVGMGIPELEARVYDGKVRGGHILLAVHVESGCEQQLAESILEKSGARSVATKSEAPVPADRTLGP